MIRPYVPYYVGMVAPVTIPVILLQQDFNEYLFNEVVTVIDTATLHVLRPDGSTAAWDCAFFLDIPKQLVLILRTVQAGDFTIAGTYDVYPEIFHSASGTARFQTFPLVVLDAFQPSF